MEIHTHSPTIDKRIYTYMLTVHVLSENKSLLKKNNDNRPKQCITKNSKGWTIRLQRLTIHWDLKAGAGV